MRSAIHEGAKLTAVLWCSCFTVAGCTGGRKPVRSLPSSDQRAARRLKPERAPRKELGSSPRCRVPSQKLALAERLNRTKARCGDLLLVARDQGVEALTPRLEHVAWVTRDRAKHLRLRSEPGSGRSLYYFVVDKRQLRRLQLRSGEQRVLAQVPLIRHRCFLALTGSGNPLEHIQEQRDLALDIKRGIACITVQDRNTNMMSMEMNFRIALDTGKVQSRVTFADESCKQEGIQEQKALCDTASISAREFSGSESFDHPSAPGKAMIGRRSPSGRWVYFVDTDLGEQEDYIYSAAFIFDVRDEKTYAILADRLVAVDYARLRKTTARPDKICLMPGEATVTWMKKKDVLVLEGCEEGLLVIEPPRDVRRLRGAGPHFTVF